ncbi:hypothetical protein CYFUS_006185 [Cystobacter fuscus]|uniref:Uncharacterized protein n=1 Tax=Cystobacter fuscus TaxID=43 RepID=A0A250J9X1_9BACT|nr:hypothetical protein CYFUS_006185 [Cystobacter fuscus]
MDEHSHYALSHPINMTLRKKREWTRVFIGAGHQGLSRLGIILFSVECASHLGTVVPVFVALRVVLRIKPTRGQRVRSAWRMPPTWAPRALEALAVGIALWGVLSLPPKPIRVAPSRERPMPEDIATDWLTRDGGAVAVPMPPKRLERQQAPPCTPPPGGQVEINGGCWSRMEQRPPCGQFYEHQGQCYVPVRETPRSPTSVDP